jgi:hypothetical protein
VVTIAHFSLSTFHVPWQRTEFCRKKHGLKTKKCLSDFVAGILYFGTMPFAALAAAQGFHKLSPDHSQCKNANHIGDNTAEWVPGT